MSLEDTIINVQISVAGAPPTVQGFGTPMFACYHANYPALIKLYLDPAGLLADGFTTQSPAYRMANVAAEQNPNPGSFYLGRRQHAYTQIQTLTLWSLAAGYVYTFTILDDTGAPFPVQYTSTGVVNTDALAIATAFNVDPTTFNTTGHLVTSTAGAAGTLAFANNAVIRNGQPVVFTGGTVPTGLTAATTYYMVSANAALGQYQVAATVGGNPILFTTNGTGCTAAYAVSHCILTQATAVLTLTNTAGTLTDIAGLPIPSKNVSTLAGSSGTITYANTTADPGIVGDLQAIAAVDNIDYYGIALDSNGDAEIEAAASYVETQIKILSACNASSAVALGITPNVQSVLVGNSYTKTHYACLVNESLSYYDAGLMANRLTTQPGASIWADIAVVGVTPDSALLGNLVPGITQVGGSAGGANVYLTMGGLGCALTGQVPAGGYIDTYIFVDWLRVNIQAVLYNLQRQLAGAGSKIPYTDAGGAMVQAAILGVLQAGTRAPTPGMVPGSVFCNVPSVASILAATPANVANRIFGPVTFGGTLAGAIVQLKITGTLAL